MAIRSEVVDRIIELIHTCVPAENLSMAFWPAVGCVVGGVILVFWGARLIRGLIALVGVGVGGYVGWLVAQHLAKPAALGIVGGAVVLGLLAVVLGRLWIAGLSGVLAGVVALAVYGFHQDFPQRFEQFTRSARQPVPTADSEFPLGERGASTAKSQQGPAEVIRHFAEDLHRRQDPLFWSTVFLVGGAVVVGAVVGLMAARWAMIFWTSLTGLALTVGGLVVLVAGPWPDWHKVAMENAVWIMGGMAVVWFVGVIVQWRGTGPVTTALCRPAETVVRVSASPR